MGEHSTIHVGDCLEWLRTLPDASVDSCVTDPPYGLGKEPDPREVLAAWLSDERFQPGGRGFMGKAWDAFVPSPLVWAEVFRVLKPGGHLLAFAGSRTYDWIALGVRLAGFEIRDQLMWIYGSGFPKSHNVSKAIDRAAGAKRKLVGTRRLGGNAALSTKQKGGTYASATDSIGVQSVEVPVTAPATEAARKWDGWGTALKPAHEPLVWARKPLSAVPGGDTLAECSAIMEALLWSMSPARIVELCSPSSEAERGAGSGSVPWTAAVLPKVSSLGESGLMGMFNSREAAETFWSIATSWNSILGASWALASTSITRTEIDLITAWRTCASLASLITPESITRAAIQAGGIWWSAPNAGPSSSAGGWSCKPTPTHIAAERATSEIVARASRELARIAGQLSAQSEGPTRSSAGESATTPAVAPDHRPIVMARKPFRGSVAANVLEHGTGAINVDGCRVGTDGGTTKKDTTPMTNTVAAYGNGLNGSHGVSIDKGRWPANIMHDGSAEVVAGFPVTKSGGGDKSRKGEFASVAYGQRLHAPPPDVRKPETGSAARFFYSPKASRKEREWGLDALGDYRGTTDDGREVAADNAYQRGKTQRRNIHPTVKPVALIGYLQRLITPPGGVTIDPYLGSGTAAMSATWEGFTCHGCELDTAHATIAHLRHAYALDNPCPYDQPKQEPEAELGAERDAPQLDLFGGAA